MACCVAVVYLFSLGWRGIRLTGRLFTRLIGSAGPPDAVGFAPPARREVRLPTEASVSMSGP